MERTIKENEQQGHDMNKTEMKKKNDIKGNYKKKNGYNKREWENGSNLKRKKDKIVKSAK